MKGYLNNEIATNDVLSKDGWFDTGDLGFLIPNGSLFITGRAKWFSLYNRKSQGYNSAIKW